LDAIIESALFNSCSGDNNNSEPTNHSVEKTYCRPSPKPYGLIYPTDQDHWPKCISFREPGID